MPARLKAEIGKSVETSLDAADTSVRATQAIMVALKLLLRACATNHQLAIDHIT
jgi:hypothetical protein